MKQIVFFGSSAFSVIVLQKLLNSKCQISNVVTTDDKPAGRHLLLTPNPVKIFALENRIQLDDKFPADAIGLVAAYGKIIPQRILDMFNDQIYNIHPSLLPKFRGPSPLQQQILDGLTETGITIIQLDFRMDHGPIVASLTDSIHPDDTWVSLGNRLFEKGTDLFLSSDLKSLTPQEDSLATYTKKLTRQDGFLPWEQFIKFDYDRKFRAYFGWPGIWSIDPSGQRVKLASLKPLMVQYPGQKPITYA